MTHQIRSLRISMIILIVALAASAFAVQGPPPQKDMEITSAIRTEVIEGALKGLNDRYVFPETAKKMEAAIKERVEKKEYDNITSATELAKKLTTDLREVSHDKHLSVGYSAEVWPVQQNNSGPTPQERAQRRKQMAAMNYAFEKVERLPGNIGYIDFRGFFDPDAAGDTLAGAMNFLANTDALIFDMRRNGGGEPAMVCLVCSYLFDEPVHLNDIYWRPDDSTKQYWTLPHVSGKRYLGKDVYVLTSHFTFSGAEEFTYNLKNLKRATIVGEVTGGGAHPGGPVRINDHFFVRVPAGRAINPITKTNWEGTGVKPDVEVTASVALKAAHVMALRKSLDKSTDSERRSELERAIKQVESAKS